MLTWGRPGGGFVLERQLHGQLEVCIAAAGSARLEGPSQLLVPPGPLIHS